MNDPQADKNTARKRGGLFALLIMVNLLFLILFRIGLTMPPEHWAFSFVSLFQNVFFDINRVVDTGITTVKEYKTLRKDYLQALTRLQELELKENEFDNTLEENKRLRNQLGFSSKTTESHLMAEIVARDPSISFNGLTINKGQRDGVRVNMPVIAYIEGKIGLVGKIREVGTFSSLVIPVYDSSFYVASRFNKNRYEGLIQGLGTGNDYYLMLKHVNKRAIREISVDDLVETSGINSLYPSGIAIGHVKTIKSREYDTSLEIIIDPVVNFSKLEFVTVLLVREKKQP
jgi:rod shape-determining protein MreC